MRLDRALDRFIGDMARRNCSPRSRSDYFSTLCRLFAYVPADAMTADVTKDALLDCLGDWAGAGPNTRYKADAIFRAFCKWLYENELVDRNPLDRVARPKRLQEDEMPLRATPAAHVRRLFEHCETWQELVCLSTLAYVGARRGAVSRLRWRNVDIAQGVVTLAEKGGKVISKPMPGAYLAILRAAVAQGGVEAVPSAYVIPMQRPQRRQGERDDRIIWRIVKRIGQRAGVEVFPHALRHAFSVRFLEQHPGEVEALQRLLGHSRLETTQRYLRAMERRLMERVRDLSWDVPFEAIAEEAPTRIELVYEALQASA
jgi:site-specific recombinase XerD